MSSVARELPPQAPSTGLWQRLLGRFYVTGVFWYRFHDFGVRILPSWAMPVFILLFTSFFFVALRRIRRAIAANLEAVLGPCGWLERQRRIYRTMWNFAWCLSERYEGLSTDRRISTTHEGREIWDAITAEKQGFILVTAHIGHWEVGSFTASAEVRRTVHLIREKETDPRAQRFVEELIARQTAGYAVHFAQEDFSLGARLLAALRRGDLVALQGDRPRTGGRTVQVLFFDRPLGLPGGPAALARATGAKLLPVFVLREGRLRARVVFRPPIAVARSRDRDADVAAATREIAANVEWAVRRRPYQWFVFRELWP